MAHSTRSRRVLLAALLLCGLGGAALYRWWQRDTPEALLATARAAAAAGQTEQLLHAAERLERSGFPDHARLLRAEWLWQRGEAAAALALANGLAADGPLRLEAALLAGKCLLDLEERPEAYRVFSWLLDQNDNCVDAHRGLAALAYDLGQWSKAEHHLRRVTELDPDDPRPWRLMGLMNKDLSRWEAAEQAYRQALARPWDTGPRQQALLELVEVLLRRANYAEALQLLEGAGVETAEQRVAMVALQAEALYGLGRAEEAARLIDELPPEEWSAPLWRLRGRLLRDEGRYAQAADCLQKAVDLDRTDAEAWHLLAQLYHLQQRHQDAEAARQRVAELHRQLQRLTELTQQAIERPWDPEVRRELAAVHQQMGHQALATMWKRAADVCTAAAQ